MLSAIRVLWTLGVSQAYTVESREPRVDCVQGYVGKSQVILARVS